MKLFLDTNVYIIGQQIPDSPEDKILQWISYYGTKANTQTIISQELINQILRVGKRLQGKDWAAKIITKIWLNLDCLFVPETEQLLTEAKQILANKTIPREDIFIYLTAKYGEADSFISSNRELIRQIADFECLNSENFIQKYLC
ncbi:MAG: PIN domain-containing protein [Snowella sp.]|nr:PIN domain-containing protein [Snowella sp.]